MNSARTELNDSVSNSDNDCAKDSECVEETEGCFKSLYPEHDKRTKDKRLKSF